MIFPHSTPQQVKEDVAFAFLFFVPFIISILIVIYGCVSVLQCLQRRKAEREFGMGCGVGNWGRELGNNLREMEELRGGKVKEPEKCYIKPENKDRFS